MTKSGENEWLTLLKRLVLADSKLPDNYANDKFQIKRRSSAHSAYWMSNALVPAGLIMMYRYGWAIESLLGLLFIGIGLVGFSIYKQKMSVPLIRHDGTNLIYSPSASPSCSIEMSANPRFTVRELGLTAEIPGIPQSRFDVSRLDFNSNADWHLFIRYLKREPVIVQAADS